MPVFSSIDQAHDHLLKAYAEAVKTAVQTLLQGKHLYQSVLIDVPAIVKANKVQTTLENAYERRVSGAAIWPWFVQGFSTEHLFRAHADRNSVTWSAPDVKTYCPQCRRVEPFNPGPTSNLLQGDGAGSAKEQVFAMSYVCQSCKGVPHVFVVHKSGTKLTLSGRAPMESVQTPKAIPRTIANYYSDATIAFQSGQTLAALFFLRTLIEQWARLNANPGDLADAAIDAYIALLPEDFKSRFQSLRTMYSALSAALHSVKADAQLFTEAASAIVEHFDARKLYKIADPSPISAAEPKKK